MFFFFLCGEHTFRSEIPGYEGMVCQCHHCGNMAAHVVKTRPFFTLCFIPVIPFTISGYKDVTCNICHFQQPLENRPDVMAMANGGNNQGQPPPPPQQGYQPQPGIQQGPPPGEHRYG